MSVSQPVFAANWKMHLGPSGTAAFVRDFAARHEPAPDRSVVFFPPSISLTAFRHAAGSRPDLQLGVQDVHQERFGAHTGAISAEMAADAGARWGLAGHSERRREFGDTDALVAAKVKRLYEAGLQPVLCVGETLDERETGRLEEVLSRQVGAVLAALDGDERESLVYAYEPVWAIGTGRTATPADAADAHRFLREEIGRLASPEIGSRAVILYGGSVKPANIAALLAAEGVDGVLVGGASLDPEGFAAICKAGRGAG
ncbi:MAG: triose-phosphate isomerase [Gemmatimonadota bacterium]